MNVFQASGMTRKWSFIYILLNTHSPDADLFDLKDDSSTFN